MSIEDKANETVVKLVRMTVKGELTWERLADPEWLRILTYGTDDFVDVAYQASLAGNRFVLYDAKFKSMDGDEHIFWANRLTLKLVDEHLKPIWEFPSLPALHALFRKVQMEAAGIEERLDSILKG